MKLTIFAVIMLIGGVGCLSDQNAVSTGLICIAIGIGIIVWKVIKKRNSRTQWTNQSDQYQSIQNQSVQQNQYTYNRPIQQRPTQNQSGVNTTTVNRTVQSQPTQNQSVPDQTVKVVFSHSDNSTQNDDDNEYEKRHADAERLGEIRKRYDAVVRKHFDLTEQIGVAYTVANNLSVPNSKEMDQVIRLCEEDIGLAKIFKEYWLEMSKSEYYGSMYSGLPEYSSYKRLAIIYEKRKEYDKAIEVCKQAIELGYMRDGTEGQMPGRIARLMRKSGNARTKINQADSVESEFAE